MTEDEMVGWHHRLDGHEFEWTPGVGDGQGSLACCSPWGHKELDMTEWLLLSFFSAVIFHCVIYQKLASLPTLLSISTARTTVLNSSPLPSLAHPPRPALFSTGSWKRWPCHHQLWLNSIHQQIVRVHLKEQWARTHSLSWEGLPSCKGGKACAYVATT